MARHRQRSARALDPSLRRALGAIGTRHRTDYVEPVGSSTSIPNLRQVRSRSRRDISQRNSSAETGLSATGKQYHPTGSSSIRNEKRQTSARSRSRPRRRKVLASTSRGRVKPLSMTPSRYWSALPMRLRLIILFLGFVFIYYIVFAKHHYFDREATAIRNDVQNLIRKANQSGFMHQLFIDAKLPDIFLEDRDLKHATPPPTKANYKSSLEVKGRDNDKDKSKYKFEKPDKKEYNKHDEADQPEKEEKDQAFEKKFAEKETNKNTDQDIEQAENVKGAETPSTAGHPTSNEEIPPPKIEEAEEIPVSGISTEERNEGSEVIDSDSPADANDKSISPPIPPKEEGKAENPPQKTETGETQRAKNIGKSPIAPEIIPSTSPSDIPTKKQSNQTEEKLPNAELSGESGANQMATDSYSATQNNGTENGDQALESPLPNAAQGQENSNTSILEALPQESIPVPSPPIAEYGNTFDEADYSKIYRDLSSSELPDDQLPLLVWNYKSLYDKNVTEQLFGLGNKLDHVATYKPICIDTTKETAFLFEGKSICSGFNRTTGWLINYCSVMKSTVHKDYLLPVEEEHKPISWLADNEQEIRWVEGLTVLQVLEKNCGNIAHFAGRILLLQHILENLDAYSIPPRNPANILIMPSFHVMKRFLYPHNYEYWHKYLFKALMAPHDYKVGTLGNFLYRESKREDNTSIIQLLHNFSTTKNQAETKKYVCFRRAIVPSYLKARFFVNDAEIPSTKPSLQSRMEGAPSIPRDSLRLRERVSALIDQKVRLDERAKEIMLLDRTGPRRVFDPKGREKVLSMMRRVAEEKGYRFIITSFDNMTFDKQYQVMKKVSVAVGIHGANLVNTMLMPPLSVLFEIFPYGFHHEMYENGGNAGLKYFSYMMKEGKPFEGPKVYRSVEQCIRLDPKCKVHYRDGTLQVNNEDLADMERILREGITWCDALPKTVRRVRRRKKVRRTHRGSQ